MKGDQTMEAQKTVPVEKNNVVPISNLSIENQLAITGQQMVEDAKGMRIECETDYENAPKWLKPLWTCLH